jgi:hypothetical protein
MSLADLTDPVEQFFFALFARANEAIWPLHIVWYAAAIVAVFLAIRPIGVSGRLISAFLTLYYFWIGVVYHGLFYSRINDHALPDPPYRALYQRSQQVTADMRRQEAGGRFPDDLAGDRGRKTESAISRRRLPARQVGSSLGRFCLGLCSQAHVQDRALRRIFMQTKNLSRIIPSASLPIERDLTLAYRLSLVVAALMALVSVAGLIWGSEGLYGVGSPSVLVSRGGDAANLILVPILLGSMWLARRGSMIGLLLWPGALFYALYAYAIYLLGAPFTVLVFAYLALVVLSASTLIGIVASLDGEEVRHRLAGAPVRNVGGALVAIALLAYAGLTATALGMLANPSTENGMRPQWVIDCALGTPVLLLGGTLLWRRSSLGYVVGPGLLFVSGLGGVAFSVAAAIDDLLGGSWTEPAVIAVHLLISTVSFALLAFFVRGARWRAEV